MQVQRVLDTQPGLDTRAGGEEEQSAREGGSRQPKPVPLSPL